MQATVLRSTKNLADEHPWHTSLFKVDGFILTEIRNIYARIILYYLQASHCCHYFLIL